MYLSDILTYEGLKKELEAHNNRICILAGVGAGKNYFIENIVAPEVGNIMYVSSRRMTVDGIKKQEELEKKFWEKFNYKSYEYVVEQIDPQHRFVTTNAMIEILLRSKDLNEILHQFEYFIFDECHSLYADATFSSAPFHVLKLIEYISSTEELSNKKIILMTGTEEPIKNYLESNNLHILDYTNQCNNIKPKVITIIKKNAVQKRIQELIEKGYKILYMTTTTNTKEIKKLIPSIRYAFCMNKEKEKKLENEERIKSEEVRDCLINNRCLPDNIDALFCTSTLKEGVNIEDKLIKVAFCESHILSDIRQFMGRVRTKLDVLYIVDDASQYFDYGKPIDSRKYEYDFSKKYAIEVCNQYLADLLEEKWNDLTFTDEPRMQVAILASSFPKDYDMQYSYYSYCKEASDFINYIESKFDYMKFNHLTNTFEIYENKIDEEYRVNEYRKRDYITELESFCADSDPKILFFSKYRHADNLAHVDKLKEFVDKEFRSRKNKKGYYGDDAKILKDSIYQIMNWTVKKQTQINRINNILRKFEIEYEIKSYSYHENKHLKIVKL